jgi:hypothetical protein
LLYESLANTGSVDASTLLHDEGLQPDPAGLAHLPPDISLAPPNHPEDPALGTPASSPTTSAKKTPGGRRSSQSSRAGGGGPTDPLDEHHLERIRKKNRDAATKFRQRQRDLGSSLEAKIAELSDERTGLLGERDSLRSEALALTSQLNALQCLVPQHPVSPVLPSPGLSSAGLLSPGLLSPGASTSVLSPGFDVGYGDLLPGGAEAAPREDMALSELSIPQNFSVDGSSGQLPEDYIFYSTSDSTNNAMYEDQR